MCLTWQARLQIKQEARSAQRLTWRLRWLTVRGLAAVSAGIVVLGIGGRLVMLASRLIHDDAVGRLTDNGNRIGEFTVEGTIGLILFGGLLGGLLGALVWAFVRSWIVPHPVLVGVSAVGIGGFLLVEADNRDFAILDPPTLDLLMLLALVFVFGVAIVEADRWFDRHLPAVGSTRSLVTYALLVGVGGPVVIPLFANFFSRDFCLCDRPPVWTGVFLLSTAGLSLWWWLLHIRGAETPQRWMRVAGGASVALAVSAGALHLAGEITAIL